MTHVVIRGWMACAALMAALAGLGTARAADSSNYYSYSSVSEIGAESVVDASQSMTTAGNDRSGDCQITADCCGCTGLANACGSGCGNSSAGATCLDPWAFSFLQTVEYGTSLALPIALTPLNVVTPVFQDDFQFQTNARLQRQFMVTDTDSFIVGQGYYQNLHPKVNQLDLVTPSAFAQYNRRLSDRVVGTLDYNYAYYFLNGSSYVTQNRTGASLFFRQNDWWDWKIRADYANANFRQTNALDSDNYSGQIEAIRYATSARTNYWTGGYGTGLSNAFLNGFSYNVNSVFAGGRWVLDDCQLHDLRVIASYAFYDFQAPDPLQPGVVRRDEIFTINSTLTRTLNTNWKAFASYTYYNSDSNVIRQQYHQNIVALGAAGNW